MNFTDNERGEVACLRSPTSQDTVGAGLKPAGLTPLLGLAAPLHPPHRHPRQRDVAGIKATGHLISAQPPISAPKNMSSMIPLVSTDTKTTPMHAHTHTCASVFLITLRGALLVSAKLQPHTASLGAPLNALVPCPQGREQGRDTVTSSFSPPRGRAACLHPGEAGSRGTTTMLPGGAGNGRPGHADPCPQGGGQWLLLGPGSQTLRRRAGR